MNYPNDLTYSQLRDEIDEADAITMDLEITPEQKREIDRLLDTGSTTAMFPKTSFYDDTLPPLVEAVYLAWSERGYRSIQCAGAVRKLCEAWEEMLG